jgi:hypothetical protein
LRHGVEEGEVDQLAGGVLVGEAAFDFDRLAQLAVERLDRVGGVDNAVDTPGGKASNGVTCSQASSHTLVIGGNRWPHFSSKVSSAAWAASASIAV